MMARGDSLMCSRNPGSNYKSGLIAPKRIPTSVPTTPQQNSKSFMCCRSGKRPVENYNERRPHASLDGMTPDQAYFTPLPFRSAA